MHITCLPHNFLSQLHVRPITRNAPLMKIIASLYNVLICVIISLIKLEYLEVTGNHDVIFLCPCASAMS